MDMEARIQLLLEAEEGLVAAREYIETMDLGDDDAVEAGDCLATAAAQKAMDALAINSEWAE